MPLVGRFVREVLRREDARDRRRAFYEVNRRMITAMVDDVVQTTLGRLEAERPATVDGITLAKRPTVTFSEGMAHELRALRSFLFAEVYRHERLMRPMRHAEAIVEDLFQRYSADPSLLPGERGLVFGKLDAGVRARAICDFIAGMTDRFAIAEHRRLFDVTPDLG
ncbi:MAG: hypothetical protein R3D67_08775 [Hyphomicrobiaceae bacterium]